MAGCASVDAAGAQPGEGGGDYTHTLVFPVFAGGCVLLGLKRRGFGAGTVNGFGGKIERADTSTRRSVLRELREETALVLPETAVRFAGRVEITVHNGERVVLAVYTTAPLPESLLPPLKAPEEDAEITPFLAPLSADPTLHDSVPSWARNAPLRPEHILYLPHLFQANPALAPPFRLQIAFDEEPLLRPRPENHRTVTHWHFTLYNL